jgi:hypothetical protein
MALSAQEPHPAAPLRGRSVRVLAPESAGDLARELARLLEADGHRVEVTAVRRYPTGDSIVGVCQRALQGCEVVLAVLTAEDNSYWARRELQVQLSLCPPAARPRLALLLRGARAEEPPPLPTIDFGQGADRQAADAALRALCSPGT